jgi:hypothetical protein
MVPNELLEDAVLRAFVLVSATYRIICAQAAPATWRADQYGWAVAGIGTLVPDIAAAVDAIVVGRRTQGVDERLRSDWLVFHSGESKTGCESMGEPSICVQPGEIPEACHAEPPAAIGRQPMDRGAVARYALRGRRRLAHQDFG